MITHITYYTDLKNTFYYENCCLSLQNQMSSLNLPFYFEKLQSKENYLQNCLLKPKFILDCLNKLNTPVYWIDVDSLIINYPQELKNFENCKNNYDFGFVIKSDKKVPESALIYFNNTAPSKLFLEEWAFRCKIAAEKEDDLDHPILMDLFLERKNNLNYKHFSHDICNTKSNYIKLIMSKTPSKRELEQKVISKRIKDKKIW